jgi:hypothetical protein
VHKLTLTLLAGSALALGACGGNKATNNSTSANMTGTTAGNGMMETGNSAAGGTGATGGNTASAWPEGSRIVVEEGVTYRVSPSGSRVRLEANDSRVVVENGVRYRVDPGGARVRIDDRGAVVRIGDSTIKGNAPNGRSDTETPGEAATDAVEDAAEAVGDVVPD